MVDRLVHSEANARRISLVEHSFGSSGQPLSKTGRVLVGEGLLTKLCRKKAKPKQFFLFNDILVYGSIVLGKKYNKQHILPLEDVKLQSLENDGPWKNGWQVISPTKSFAVFAATPTEKAEWMAHINKCIVDLLAKTNKKPAKEHAAVWVPDSDATTCMHCLKTKFTPINRRHHCRKCGAVVCGSCSNRRFLLPYQDKKPLRVCISCYEALTAGEADRERATGQGPPPSTLVEPNNHHGDYEVQPAHWSTDNGEALAGQESGDELEFGSSDGEDDDDDEDSLVSPENTEPVFYRDT